MERIAQKPTPAMRRLPVWLWLLQRVSGVLIAGLVVTHMVINHYVDASVVIDVAYVEADLRQVTLVAVDSLLLLLGLFHGLTGLRNVLYDYVGGDGGRRLIDVACLASGLSFFAFGIAVLAVVIGR